MRALVCKEFGSFEKLVVEDRDEPVPGDGEIVFEVKAAGLNFADILGIAGQYQVKETPPFIAGNEAAGIVTAVRDGGYGQTGDRVVITAGVPFGTPGATNTLRIAWIF